MNCYHLLPKDVLRHLGLLIAQEAELEDKRGMIDVLDSITCLNIILFPLSTYCDFLVIRQNQLIFAQ